MYTLNDFKEKHTTIEPDYVCDDRNDWTNNHVEHIPMDGKRWQLSDNPKVLQYTDTVDAGVLAVLPTTSLSTRRYLFHGRR